ncbi:hypothetical protein BP5796_08305 [Coleophoma crateriformis]|uniref:Xylanolytic transcriptional activator regulatory domain-containing protein n=1 Tax=Coleophoma crateriformis TaxID=565419 RepID=A0A3D8R7K4_9HELO|nr:hypothetical protein BP5796_08305 [Coleophoma crateriformis]
MLPLSQAAAKRSHSPPSPALAASPVKRSRSVVSTPTPQTVDGDDGKASAKHASSGRPAADYPRKRVASHEEKADGADVLSKIFNRLERMEPCLERMEEHLRNSSTQPLTADSFPAEELHRALRQPSRQRDIESLPTPESYLSPTDRHVQRNPSLAPLAPWTGQPILTFKPAETHEISIPRLEGFRCLPPFNAAVYDDTEGYYQREFEQGATLYQPHGDEYLDLTPSVCYRLQRLFTKNVLIWVPIFDAEYCSAQFAEAVRCGFSSSSISVAITMFVLALGAISNEEEYTGNCAKEFAGISYFQKACKIVDENRGQMNSIIVVQCRILWSLYALFCMRSLQAWNAISEASRDVVVLCHFRSRMESDSQFGQMVRRAYWACYIIEYELKGPIRLSQGLRMFQETMPLPSSEHNEPGFFYFLSEIALWRLYESVFDNIGFSAGLTRYAPVVALELCSQLSEWYENLPGSLKFPRGTMPLLDPQKAFLRAQYYSIICVTKWSFIVRFVAQNPDFRGEQDILITQGRDCLESAVLLSKLSRSLLPDDDLTSYVPGAATRADTGRRGGCGNQERSGNDGDLGRKPHGGCWS